MARAWVVRQCSLLAGGACASGQAQELFKIDLMQRARIVSDILVSETTRKRTMNRCLCEIPLCTCNIVPMILRPPGGGLIVRRVLAEVQTHALSW